MKDPHAIIIRPRITEKTVALNARPHAVDQPYEVSWNNKQAPGFAAADDKFTFGPLYRSSLIQDRVEADLRGGRKMTIEQLVQAMEEPATEDIRGVYIVPVLAKALGKISDPRLAAAMKTLVAWSKTGAHRRDLDKDGKDDDDPAIQIMDAWWPKLVDAEFKPAVGNDAFAAILKMTGYGSTAFSDGFYGPVYKDLRDLFDRKHVRGRWSRVYCGGGSKAKCRAALLGTLSDALKVTAADLYGHGSCASTPDPACADQNKWTVASAVSIPPFPFQNRPTFQQTVEVTKRLPR